MESGGRFIGKIGKHFVSLRVRGVWVLRGLQSSMMLCWQNRYGDLFMIPIHYFIVFKSKCFPNGTIFDAKNLWVLLLGKVY